MLSLHMVHAALLTASAVAAEMRSGYAFACSGEGAGVAAAISQLVKRYSELREPSTMDRYLSKLAGSLHEVLAGT
jgi:hypothetical protein